MDSTNVEHKKNIMLQCDENIDVSNCSVVNGEYGNPFLVSVVHKLLY